MIISLVKKNFIYQAYKNIFCGPRFSAAFHIISVVCVNCITPTFQRMVNNHIQQSFMSAFHLSENACIMRKQAVLGIIQIML